ncbi:uncharacterized protein VTP21DRAFT_6064 [Calcarisporiella thermophila]|uniref:uncharacterized protein n=1 Tax=Calcarisporiella thermophila TaxID=911321 RepID=UPI00374318D9
MSSLIPLILDGVEYVVKQFSAEMPLSTNWLMPLSGSWYLSPRQHATEILVFNLFFGVLFFVYAKALYRQGNLIPLAFQNFTPSRSATFTDFAVFVLTLASTLLIAIHKIIRSSLLCMFQPCHANMTLLSILLFFGWKGEKKNWMVALGFNVYLHYVWATVLALVQPDLRNFSLLFEQENFWLVHVLLLVVPIYMVHSGRYPVFPLSLEFALFSYAAIGLYHVFVLESVVLISGVNINYMLSPPPGLLQKFGPYYRILMYVGGVVLSLISRYVIIESSLSLFDRKRHSATEKKRQKIESGDLTDEKKEL